MALEAAEGSPVALGCSLLANDSIADENEVGNEFSAESGGGDTGVFALDGLPGLIGEETMDLGLKSPLDD